MRSELPEPDRPREGQTGCSAAPNQKAWSPKLAGHSPCNRRRAETTRSLAGANTRVAETAHRAAEISNPKPELHTHPAALDALEQTSAVLKPRVGP